MGGGKATSQAQRVGTVAEQLDEGKPPAELPQIPWAVDVRHRLEQADDADRQQRRNDEVRGRAAQHAQALIETRRRQQRERHGNDCAYEPAAASVDELIHPPAVCTHPAQMLAIEKAGACDRDIGARRREHVREHDECRERHPHM